MAFLDIARKKAEEDKKKGVFYTGTTVNLSNTKNTASNKKTSETTSSAKSKSTKTASNTSSNNSSAKKISTYPILKGNLPPNKGKTPILDAAFKATAEEKKSRTTYGSAPKSSYTDFNTETKNAYTSAKNKASTKTTITSNLTEKERKARIKEIEQEMTSINTTLNNLGLASGYGGKKNKENLENQRKEAEKRKAQLSEELKKLKRVGTFSASELKQFEIDDAKARKAALPNYNPTARIMPYQADAFKANIQAHNELDKEIDRLEREKAEYKYFEKLDELNAYTTKITSKSDFVQNAKYSPIKPKTNEELEAEGYKQNADGEWYKVNLSGVDLYTGEDSDLYLYINDKKHRQAIKAEMLSSPGYNNIDHYEKLGYHTLFEEEIGAFNYLYHQDRKNGTNTAEEYLKNISPLLQQRAMEIEATRYAEMSKEAPVFMSGVSLGTNLANGLMFPAKVAATATGIYEDIPILDMYGNRTQAIRGAVSEDMGTVGKLAYNATMSIGDMGVAMLAGGGNAKVIQAIMSSSAGSSTISQAKKNGASDGKALILGLGSAAIEWATEKYSVEAILKKPKSILGYLATNTFTEATEEGASNVSNLVLDAIVSEVFGERNEIEQRIDYLVLYEGKTEEEALNIAFTEKLQSLGEDVLVGGITGFGMSSAVATPVAVQRGIDRVHNKHTQKDNAPLNTTVSEEGSTIPKQQTSTPATLEQAAIDVVNERNRTNTPTYTRLEALSRSNEPIAVEDVKKASGFGDNGAKLLTEIASQDGMTFVKARDEMKVAYLSGYNGEHTTFTSDLQNRAKLAGVDDRIADNNIAIENAKNATVYKGAFTENEHTRNWSKATKKMVATVAKHFGMDIASVDRIIANELTGAEANASHNDGKMRISNNRTAEKLIHALVIHESGHRMEQFATDEWNELSNFLYNRAERLGRRAELGFNRGMAFDAVKAQHDNAGISMSTKDYIGEIAVRELETIFSSAEEFNNFIAEIESNQQAKSGFQKIVDFILELIEDVKRLIAETKMSKEEREEARKELAELERIKELYAKAYIATKNAVAERANAQANQSVKTQKNTDIEGSNVESKINFDLREDAEAEVTKVLNGTNTESEIKLTDSSPAIMLGHKGVKNLPMTMIASHIRENILTEAEAKAKGLKVNKNINYHGLGKELFLKVIAGLDNVTEAYRGTPKAKDSNRRENYFLLISQYTDGEGNIINVPVFINEKGLYNRAFIDTNKIATVFGREQLRDYITRQIQAGNLVRIKKRSPQTSESASPINAHYGNGTSTAEQSATSDTSSANDRIPQNPKSVKSDFSLKDNEGNTLTETQAEFFKDSKVRDENGNLLVMYQGASEDFTVFDRKKSSYANLYGRGFYFTKSEKHASQYGNTRAYYLDITHPVSTTETTITKPQLRKFLQAVIDNEDYSFENYGYGATVDSVLQSTYGKSDFLMLNDVSQTAIGDLVEAVELFNEINGTDYDGIMLDTETVTFNSKQAKLTTNKKPTNNPDIRFSLKESVEETKNLIAVHNTTEEKLLGALKLGGLPSPSIAITKNDMSHEKFGDISLVFRKDSISPTDRRNKIYSGDAYTPTGVRVEYDVDDDILQEFNKRLKELTPEWSKERLPSVDSGTAEAKNDSLYNAYERNDRAKFAFLREKGKAPKIAMRTPRLSYFVSNDTVIALAKAFSTKQLIDIANTSDGVKQYKNAFLKVIRDTEDSRIVASGIYSADEASMFDVAETASKAKQVKENKYKIKKEIDLRNTSELIDKKFTKALKEEYRKWIDENTKDAIIDKGIRNNRDLFTPSGKRRTFKQLHEPYNLSNIIKQMFSGEDKGIALFGGSPIGAAQHEYSRIADVKADSGRIQQLEQEEYDKIRDEIEGDVLDLAQRMKINSDVFTVRDLLSEAIGKKTKQQADTYLKREAEGWAKYSPDFTNELWDIRNRILSMPTEYFEAKPQRAVDFNEVVLAVVPKGKTVLRKQLENAGVQKVVYYDKAKDGDRLAKLNSVPNVNFSLKETDTTSSKDRKELLDIIEHLKGEFEITKLAKSDPKKLAKMTKDILKDYSSQVDYDETYKAIDELYLYMANGEDGYPAVWEDVYNRAYDIAQEIISNALVVDDYMYQEYKSLRNYLRTTPMKFYSDYDSSPIAYENFNEFRKANFGRLKFTKDGMSIDSVYQELSSLYPEFFDTERDNNTSDQLERIVEVLDEIQPTEINPYDREIQQASMFLANDVINRFFDIPQAKPTFADKAERRVIDARIAGAKKVEAVRLQKDAKIQKLLEAQKEKTKKQLNKLRQQRDDKVKKEQAKRRDAISKMSENQKAKVLRAQIIRHAGELSKKLVNPTDNQHIPQELQGAVAKLLECINLESNYTYDTESHSYKKNDEGLPSRRTQAFNELRDLYSKIADTVVVDPDLMGEGGLLSDVISLADKRIADMNSSELDTVWQALRAVEASVNTANKIFSQGKFETILGFAEALREDNAGKKEKAEFKGVLGKGKRLAGLDMLTPETYFHYLGSAGDSIFRMMRNAQDKHISIMKEVADFTHKTLKDVDVNSLEETLHTVKLGGEDVKLSTAQLMELYVLMKREQAVDHILLGGILPDTTKEKGLKLNTKAEPIRNISVAEISTALSKLTAEQKKVADKLQQYVSTVLSAYGNEASMRVYNYEKFLEKNYWTIRTNKQEISSEVGKDTSVTSVANKGMAKGTVPHANTSVRIGSIFDTFASHSSDMATYAAWLGTSEDVNRIRNFVFWEDGARKGTVKGILDTVHGIHGSDYLQKLLTDVAIGVKGTDNMNPFDKLTGGYKAASVGANIRVIIQQPTAILRALDMIDARYLTEGAMSPLKGWKKAKKYAPIAQWKDWGHFDINTGRQMKDVLFDNASLLEKTKQAGMWGASMADSIAWGQLWNAVEAETKAKHKELEVGTEEYYETVAKRFTEIVDHTQVVDGILQRSQIMRSPDALTKMATSFMGEPTKQYNMAVSAVYDAKNLKGDAHKKAVAKLGRAAVALAVAGIVNACAQSFIDAMRDDDKEKDYWEKWLAAFVGDGEDTKLINSNMGDIVNPLNYVPFAKDVVSIMQGYDVKRMDADAISKTFNAVTNMYKAVTGTGKYTIAEASAALFAEIARLYGVPVANVKRDIKSIAMSVATETDSFLMQYRMEKAMLDINYAGNNKNFMDILYNAYVNDKEAYEIIYNDMIESGFEVDKIESGIETRMMKAEGVKKKEDLQQRYYSPLKQPEYDKLMKGVKSSNMWENADTEEKKKIKNKIHTYLTGDSKTAKNLQNKIEGGFEYGLDESEYLLYELALDMIDQPTGQKGSGSYSNKEKQDAMRMVGLEEGEYAYLFDTDKTYKLYDEGVTGKTYLDFLDALEMVDKPSKNGKLGSYTQNEVIDAISRLDGLSNIEKSALYLSINSTWKKNPYK